MDFSNIFFEYIHIPDCTETIRTYDKNKWDCGPAETFHRKRNLAKNKAFLREVFQWKLINLVFFFLQFSPTLVVIAENGNVILESQDWAASLGFKIMSKWILCYKPNWLLSLLSWIFLLMKIKLHGFNNSQCKIWF